MKWLLGIAIAYTVIGLAIGAYSFWTGTSLKDAALTGLFWPLSMIFIIGMLGR